MRPTSGSTPSLDLGVTARPVSVVGSYEVCVNMLIPGRHGILSVRRRAEPSQCEKEDKRYPQALDWVELSMLLIKLRKNLGSFNKRERG